METAAAAMLEAGVGRFRGPSLAALLAEMWAPLAVALAALATLPSLLRRLQVIVLRLRSRGKEVIQSHISTYYSSGDDDSSDGEDEDDDEEEESSDEAATSSSGEEDGIKRIGYFDGADAGCFPWGDAVVRTWQGLPRRFSGAAGAGARFPAFTGGVPAVRLWGASTASGEPSWWSADEGGRVAAAEAEPAAPVVLGWNRRDHAPPQRRRRRAPHPAAALRSTAK
ncbi:hypothetical protein ACP70R_006625 [Stipagrostis hirtigluma subsp. patula]